MYSAGMSQKEAALFRETGRHGMGSQVNFKVGVLGVVNVRVYVNEIVYVNWRMRICISIIRCAWSGLVCP